MMGLQLVLESFGHKPEDWTRWDFDLMMELICIKAYGNPSIVLFKHLTSKHTSGPHGRPRRKVKRFKYIYQFIDWIFW